MSVTGWITQTWAETEALLRSRPTVNYDDARNNAIAASAAALYRSVAADAVVPDLAGLNAADVVIQQQVADGAVLLLIPLAKDVVMERYHLATSDSTTPGGSGSTTYYNRLTALDQLATTLSERMTIRAGQVEAVLRGVLLIPEASAGRFPIFVLARGGRGR